MDWDALTRDAEKYRERTAAMWDTLEAAAHNLRNPNGDPWMVVSRFVVAAVMVARRQCVGD